VRWIYGPRRQRDFAVARNRPSIRPRPCRAPLAKAASPAALAPTPTPSTGQRRVGSSLRVAVSRLPCSRLARSGHRPPAAISGGRAKEAFHSSATGPAGFSSGPLRTGVLTTANDRRVSVRLCRSQTCNGDGPEPSGSRPQERGRWRGSTGRWSNARLRARSKSCWRVEVGVDGDSPVFALRSRQGPGLFRGRFRSRAQVLEEGRGA